MADLDSGRIVVAATPIGNTADASARLSALLAEADVVAAEDTRRLRALAGRLGVRIGGQIVSLHEHNEQARVAGLLERAGQGQTVLVVSDAGTPAVSDPGFVLVRAAIAEGIEVTTAPGPSAVLAALVVSGLPMDRFCFEGFVPRKTAELAVKLGRLADEPRTMVFFTTALRLAETLAAMAAAFGPDRPAVVGRELTKIHEEVRRGPLGQLADWAGQGPVLGEVAVVIGGADDDGSPDLPGQVSAVLARTESGQPLSRAVAEVAASTGLSRHQLYEAALAARRQAASGP